MAVALRVGDFVACPGGPGIARVGALDGDNACVEYFESVAQPTVEAEWVEVGTCSPVILVPGTRVYWLNPDTGAWLAGRVKARQGGRYFVQFPNTEYDLPVEGRDLRVRWDHPVQDPVQVLAAGGIESGYFYGARLPMLRNLVEQRAACTNVPALLSSAAEVYPHQVRAALTVLTDPVQRYLLADEVGLGKTIEAGYVIRQTLIDNPRSKITILTPDTLRRQWRRELTEKFFIDDFPLARIKLTRHEDPVRWREYHGSDLVVVDEAHWLVQVRDPDESPYRELRELAHSSPRLLLLSATPVTSHHTTHLGLLHLLEPHLYRWDDREAFEHRQARRSELADSVYALDSTFAVLLPSTIDSIRVLLPPDARFEELASQVLQLLADDDDLRDEADAPTLAIRVEGLRAHISETYRLHRRTIRHRRAHVLRDDQNSSLLPYEVRGRGRPELLDLYLPEGHDAQQTLIEWRTRIWDNLLNEDRTAAQDACALALGVLTSRAGGPADDLLDAMRWRVRRDPAAAQRASLSTLEQVLLSEPDLIGAESQVLAAFEAGVAQTNRDASATALVDTLLPVIRSHQRVVIFCGPGSLAADLVAYLRTRFPKAPIGEHTRAVGSDQAERAVTAWCAPVPAAQGRVIVADDTAEDGLNLQLADAAIHLRLPWSPNRLEQRLGRIDRYSGGASAEQSPPTRQYVLRNPGPDGSIGDAWLSLLDRGYDIFGASVSTLQDAIAQGLAPVWGAALSGGPEGLECSAERVRATLSQERADIDKMDLLESIHGTAVPARDVAAAVGDFEQRWRGTQHALLRYVGESSGGIKIRYNRRMVRGCSREIFDLGDSHPLADPRLFRVKSGMLTSEMSQGTFNRSAALRAPGTRIFRIGNPFVDLLASLIAIDDRGQATAFRRVDPRHRGEPAAYFGFDFLVEADVNTAAALVADQAGARTALRRQADRILPPFTLKVWVPAGSDEAITSDEDRAWLDMPYDNRRDQNYNAKCLHELADLFGGWATFRKSAEAAEQAARRNLELVTDLAERCARAAKHAQQTLAVVTAEARARQAAGRLVGDTDSYLVDALVTDALVTGLTAPAARVVAATCIVRSAYVKEWRPRQDITR